MSADALSPVKTTRPTRWEQIWPSLRDFLVHVLGQGRVLKKAYPGIMHVLIFWGVTVQVVGTAVNLMQMQLFIPFIELPFPREGAYLAYELTMDIAGIAILLGISMALFRRLVLRPKTLETSWEDYYALILLGLIPTAGFLMEGTRLLIAAPEWASWSPVGNLIGGLLAGLGMSAETAVSLHPILFWTHIILALGLVASIPYTKLRHLITTPLNVILHNRRKAGVLDFIDDIEETEILGIGQVSEFAPLQLLAFDACLRCGRCLEVCPAALSGMTSTPISLIQSLRQEMEGALITPNGHKNGAWIDEALGGETPWSCTTCGACFTQCPAFVNPVDAIIDLRRFQTMTQGQPPRSVMDVMRHLEQQGNPWGMPANERLDSIESLGLRQLNPGEETDVLIFQGCAAAFDDRNKQAFSAFVHLLQREGVDTAVLGFDETCCGETARRLGIEYLFQAFAEANIEAFSQVKFNRIVTQCPHCFNTLKNEYPQLGGDFPVQHYTEYLAELLPTMDVATNGNGNGRIAYHDPCYLGRYNDVQNEPRSLLDKAGVDRVEMERHGDNSFCCGGGGGQMWMETDVETRINNNRLDQARKAGADIVATACPYCLLMFDDAIRSKGLVGEIQVMDIAEVLERELA